jgi:hypothetical protein
MASATAAAAAPPHAVCRNIHCIPPGGALPSGTAAEDRRKGYERPSIQHVLQELVSRISGKIADSVSCTFAGGAAAVVGRSRIMLYESAAEDV